MKFEGLRILRAVRVFDQASIGWDRDWHRGWTRHLQTDSQPKIDPQFPKFYFFQIVNSEWEYENLRYSQGRKPIHRPELSGCTTWVGKFLSANSRAVHKTHPKSGQQADKLTLIFFGPISTAQQLSTYSCFFKQIQGIAKYVGKYATPPMDQMTQLISN